MADRRNKIMDAPVNPAIMPGLILLADDVTLTDTKTLTITFPAKWIWTVLAQTTGTSVTKTYSVTNEVATVTLLANGTGLISYLIIASVTEVGAVNTLTVDTTHTPIS